MHSYKGHVKRLFINKTRKCATESMAQNEEACLLKKKKKKGCLGMPIPCYNSCRKQMEICHGPFKKISTLRIGEQYQSPPLNNGCATSALRGLGSIMITVTK